MVFDNSLFALMVILNFHNPVNLNLVIWYVYCVIAAGELLYGGICHAKVGALAVLGFVPNILFCYFQSGGWYSLLAA